MVHSLENHGSSSGAGEWAAVPWEAAYYTMVYNTAEIAQGK